MSQPKFMLIDDIVAGIGDAVVQDVRVGLHWTAVKSRGIGLSLSPTGDTWGHVRKVGSMIGMSALELAEYAKSWNMVEASVGVAAINSLIEPQGVPGNAFEFVAGRVTGKKVAVIGHFPVIERLSGYLDLKIIDRYPQEGELPDFAAEYILPQSDVVLITGSTVANKTLPRLLELASNAYTVLVGPSTPMSPALFEHGVDALAGVKVLNEEAVLNAISQGGALRDFKHALEYLIATRA